MKMNVLISISMLALGVAVSRAADWPQYRGPNHDGVSSERIAKWPAAGPQVLWKATTTDGFSSFSVSGGKAFTIVARQVEGAPREVCVAFDANNGKELWAAPTGIAKYDHGGDSGTPDNQGGDGPRSTPSVDGDRVYVFSAQLRLVCIDANTGKEVWTKDLIKEYNGRTISWQSAASPLVDGEAVFVAGGGPGEALLAFNKKDGSVVWKSEDDRMTHATPVAATILGQRQIIFFTQSGLVSVAPPTGKVLWRYKFPYKTSAAASPVVAGDIVYCAAGYDVGAGAAKITRTSDALTATELWRSPGNKPVANHWSTPVYYDGHLYGVFTVRGFGQGPMKCVELTTGKVLWEKEGFGPGNVVLAGNQVLALSDAGELVLVETNPKAFTEVARAKVLDGKCWSTPAVSGARIYARSTKEGVCLDVSGKLAKK
jgi:outer membrane protein assembly factor BamB